MSTGYVEVVCDCGQTSIVLVGEGVAAECPSCALTLDTEDFEPCEAPAPDPDSLHERNR